MIDGGDAEAGGDAEDVGDRVKMTSSILALLGLILATAGAELSSRIVRTKYGELSGLIVTLDRYLEGVEVFRGVPYASPPIGSLRFMPPVSGALWHSVKVADKFGPVCPQKLPELSDKMPKGRVEYIKRLLPYLKNQSEDCLYLNIYAPVQGNFCLSFYNKVRKLLEKTMQNKWRSTKLKLNKGYLISYLEIQNLINKI